MKPPEESVHAVDHLQGTTEAIRAAALEAFYEVGYQGSSTREISKRAGIGVATLYHHYPSKQDILVDLVEGFFEDLLQVAKSAVEQSSSDVRDQLGRVVRSHVLFHIEHRVQGFLAYADFRSLPDEQRQRALECRQLEQRLVEHIIRRGVRVRLFGVDRPSDAGLGLLQMCSAVLSWYRKDGSMTPEEVATTYVDLSMNLVRARRPIPRPT